MKVRSSTTAAENLNLPNGAAFSVFPSKPNDNKPEILNRSYPTFSKSCKDKKQETVKKDTSTFPAILPKMSNYDDSPNENYYLKSLNQVHQQQFNKDLYDDNSFHVSQYPTNPINKPIVGTSEWVASRRQSHKEVERKRRECINQNINVLGELVPGPERNKGGILHRVVQHIKDLQQENELLRDGFSNEDKMILERLKQENKKLKEENEILKNQIKERHQNNMDVKHESKN
ncbi:hypothetical protein K502DRAFT_325838 [Neoconidiobolus thromboides FSU 785]|nr:hypothetical protein K502DRAFT_325838 [Neoconidiobolus thromboides FSU 785]